MKNIHGGELLLVKLQVLACNFTKSNTPPYVFFTFFKLYKWYQITQRITNELKKCIVKGCIQTVCYFYDRAFLALIRS